MTDSQTGTDWGSIAVNGLQPIADGWHFPPDDALYGPSIRHARIVGDVHLTADLTDSVVIGEVTVDKPGVTLRNVRIYPDEQTADQHERSTP